MKRPPVHGRGFSLIELLIAVVLAGLVLGAMTGLIENGLGSGDVAEERLRLQADARFAMQRMTKGAAVARHLLLPQPDKPATNWRENVREETVPASPPEGDSTKATAVLAFSLSLATDLDADGFPDADNDRDGRIDEDYPADIQYDFDPGIHLIDDGGDGSVDEGFFADSDDDERASDKDEDPINGIDDDGDGIVDEDPGADMNGDNAPGIEDVDDDADGQVDEGSNSDDDEDGAVDEDWIDVVVYYLAGDTLMERHPVPWDETGNGFVSGRDFVESVIAEGVTRFRVERTVSASLTPMVDLTIELTGSDGNVVSLNSRVRVSGAQ